MRHQETDRLGGVDRTAAPQADQAVAVLGPIAVEPAQDVVLRRVRLHTTIKDRALESAASHDRAG
jgi:hypothetical protein